MPGRRSLVIGLTFISVLTLPQPMPAQNERSLSDLRQRAESGDVKAQAEIGVMYEYGAGGAPRDAAEALKWYGKAARGGDTGAKLNIARMCFQGNGVARDYGEAARWYGCPKPNAQALAACTMITHEDLPQGARDALKRAKCDAGSNYDYGSAVDLNGDGEPEYQFCCKDAPHGPCLAVVVGKIGSRWTVLSPKGGVFAYGFPCGLFVVLEDRHNGFNDVCLPGECSMASSATGNRCVPTIWNFFEGRYRSVEYGQAAAGN